MPPPPGTPTRVAGVAPGPALGVHRRRFRPGSARIGRIRLSGVLDVKPLDRCVCQAALHSGAMEPAFSSDTNRHRALVVARLDRVTRSLLAWAELVERSRRRGWAIVVVAEGFDLSTDSGELTAALLASVAQYERRLIGARTREAMAAGKARGARYGRPIEHAPEARHIVGAMRAGAATLQQIATGSPARGSPPAGR